MWDFFQKKHESRRPVGAKIQSQILRISIHAMNDNDYGSIQPELANLQVDDASEFWMGSLRPMATYFDKYRASLGAAKEGSKSLKSDLDQFGAVLNGYSTEINRFRFAPTDVAMLALPVSTTPTPTRSVHSALPSGGPTPSLPSPAPRPVSPDPVSLVPDGDFTASMLAFLQLPLDVLHGTVGYLGTTLRNLTQSITLQFQMLVSALWYHH
jgi:hypothetical protein